jgi:CheY-like chemotaxis protein
MESLPQPSLHFCVEDSGIGMLPEEKLVLFDRFAQVNRRTTKEYGGTGLGLAISKRLVEIMGGAIEVQSEKWKGSKFCFTAKCELLSSEEQKQAIANLNLAKNALAQSPSSGQLKGKSVLVAEDNKVNQKILATHLQQQGCICKVVANGVEALEQCALNKFDVILMDIEMPVMRGIEATKKIREREKLAGIHTPIVGLSGYTRKEFAEEAIDSGMDAFLSKPFRRDELCTVITFESVLTVVWVLVELPNVLFVLFNVDKLDSESWTQFFQH